MQMEIWRQMQEEGWEFPAIRTTPRGGEAEPAVVSQQV